MPQDVRAAPDGRHFYVADMLEGGVFVIDGDTFTVTRFVPTGVGAHGLTPSRDGTKMYVANRGSNQIDGPPHGPGSVSVIDTTATPPRVVNTIMVGGFGGAGPWGLTLSADGSRLYVRNEAAALSIINTTTQPPIVESSEARMLSSRTTS